MARGNAAERAQHSRLLAQSTLTSPSHGQHAHWLRPALAGLAK